MSLGQNEQNPNEYHLEEKSEDGNTYQTQLNSTRTEKDLGVVVDDKLVFRNHVAQMTAKANRVVGIIRRSFDYLTEKKLLFSCIRVWSALCWNMVTAYGSHN